VDTESRSRILEEARSWLGTPYHHKGRVLGVGVDCGGLLYQVYGKFYDIKPYPETYPQDWALHAGAELYLDFISEYVKEAGSPRPAGIVVFRYGRCYSHGGIITEKNTVIHAWGRTMNGKVIESPMSFFRDGKFFRPRKYYSLKAPDNGG
jgi:cell wall-associated NlpC family hydrolase